jgi:Ca2+-binding RTX toxin-like protein
MGAIRISRVVRGTPRDDVLIGSTRSQTITGGGGNDHICAGDGNDTVHGGRGDDTIHGDARGDRLFGDSGGDRLYGDILDDHLFGGPGADTLIGGHGVDVMLGGGGNDLLRGGTNTDCYYGQGGANAASFATATPPGLPEQSIAGVRVDLSGPVTGRCPRRGSGRADGDGTEGPEALSGIQFVVGSAFSDLIQGQPGAGADAGLGADGCPGFDPARAAGCGGGDEKPAGTYSYVFDPATGAPADPGLIVVAPQGVPEERIELGPVSAPGAAVRVTGSLTAGPHCDPLSASAADCAGPAGSLGYLMAYGDDGTDAITLADGLSPDTTVDADGGPGDDALAGSNTLGEVLLGGDAPGADSLAGNGGDDALISDGGAPDSGPDHLSGGGGDDQLATDYPCAGHIYSGGRGADVAGFARSRVGIRARAGGIATLLSGGCPAGSPTSIGKDNEILEGTNLADLLIGSSRSETIWGREGNDIVVGRGGSDDLEGFAGRDLIDAVDGHRDRLIDCGSGPDRARRDRIDPRPIKC